MTTVTPSSARPARDTRRPARIAVMPAFNEAATIEAVLDDLYPRIDRLVIVNDGSVDETGPIVERWAAGRSNVSIVHFPANRGLSAALRAGWDSVRGMLERGEVRADDVCFSIDADGQHEPAALDGMIEHLVEGNHDSVIGYRDMGYHTPYKVFGNAVMTWIGRVSGWMRFHDIESGYRVFRIGPLLHAQQFYEGFKYSETVEVAVILARLGYSVDNTYRINIPVARTRTRLYDAAVDAVCMPLSWYRLACWRDLPAGARGRYAMILPAAIVGLAVVALLLMLLHGFFLADDSAQSYAHVWYLSQAIFDRGEFPLHISQLENGDALMFPYGLIPWLPAAIVRPVFGDWIVTFSMVLGIVLMVVGMWRFRHQMRNPLLFSLFLLNPLLWNGITQFQLTTMWAFAFFFFAAAEYERGRYALGAVLFAAAMYAHPMMAGAALAFYGVWEAARTRRIPWKLGGVAVAGAVLALPAVVWMFQTPLLGEARATTVFLAALDNMRRLSIVVLPLVLTTWGTFVLRNHRRFALLGAAGTAGALAFLPPSGLWERSQPRFQEYLAAHPVDPAASYRVAIKNNHEDGDVEFLKAGATLSHELFTESQRRQTFSSTDGYACLLATKNTKIVVIHGSYEAKYHESEVPRLDELVARGQATLQFSGTDGTRAYTIAVPESFRRGSVRDCDI